jgi:outer membrane lipoprotein-sorting protein
MAGKNARTILLAIGCTLLFSAAAAADDVPLPTPSPHARGSSAAANPVAPPAAANTNAAPAAAPQTRGFFPFSLPLGQNAAPSRASTLNPKQRALLDKVSLYLSSVQTLIGNFVQIGPDGRRVEGTFWMQKPGKVRFRYKPPSSIDIIADGSSVVVRDYSLETADYYPLSQTPLRYLLADRIDLARDTDVISVSADDTFITVVVEETQLISGTSRLMMMFNAKTLALKQWTVTDSQGLDTTVAVYNLDTARKPDPSLFVINYQADLK